MGAAVVLEEAEVAGHKVGAAVVEAEADGRKVAAVVAVEAAAEAAGLLEEAEEVRKDGNQEEVRKLPTNGSILN